MSSVIIYIYIYIYNYGLLNKVALKNRKSSSVRCAGAILDANWILTTAHCVDKLYM